MECIVRVTRTMVPWDWGGLVGEWWGALTGKGHEVGRDAAGNATYLDPGGGYVDV